MYCSYCGKEIPNDAVFCTYCGKKQFDSVDESDALVFQNQISEDDDLSSDDYNTELPEVTKTVRPSSSSPASEKSLGLKWYTFIVKVQLWIAMVFSVVSGLQFMQGLQYGDSMDTVYKTFPTVKGLDMGYGVIMLFMAGLAFFTRKYLIAFDEKGPKCYTLLNIMSAFLPTIYAFACSIVTGYSIVYFIDSNTIVRAVVMIVYTIINIVYFNKRKDLFAIKRLETRAQRLH